MVYKVIDPKGVAYSNNQGRQVIACGDIIPDLLIAQNAFSLDGIAVLIEDGREKSEGKTIEVTAAAPIKSSSNRKAKITGAKAGRPKKVKK